MASSPITSWQIDGKTMETETDFIFLGSKICRWWLQPWNSTTCAPWKKSYDQPRQLINKQRHYFADKGPYSQSYSFSSSQVWMLRVGPKEDWMLKNWCFQIVVLEKALEGPLGLQGNQTSQSVRKSILNVHWKGWSWSSNTLVSWGEELTHWKIPWCWERLKAKGEGGSRG